MAGRLAFLSVLCGANDVCSADIYSAAASEGCADSALGASCEKSGASAGFTSVFSIASCLRTLSSTTTVSGSEREAITLNTTMNAARLHVAFSRKSVVLRTPIIWFDDAKPDARPPPLEF